MREKRFVAMRRARWDALDALVTQVDRRSRHRLEPSEIEDLAFGYRAATSDLAIARARQYDPRLIALLEALTSRAHAYVYVGMGSSGWAPAVRFVRETFPREVRRSWQPIVLCILITVIGALVTYRTTFSDPRNAYAFVPASSVPVVEKSLHDSNFGFDRAFSPAMSSMIITNNVRVAITAFAGGATLGILTLTIIGFNGLYLGTIAALFARRGFGLDFWATISPHGVIELTAIQIAGGAGLLLAAGVVRPGRARRVDAFVRNASRAGVLVIGVAGMLVVAGLIEGFISPQRISIPLRFAVGAITGVALLAYVSFAGRDQSRARDFTST